MRDVPAAHQHFSVLGAAVKCWDDLARVQQAFAVEGAFDAKHLLVFSSRLKAYRHQSGAYEIQYPDNWQVAAGNVGLSATLYPNGGAGQEGVIYGVMVDSYLSQNQQSVDPRTRRPRPLSLETSTKEILDNTIKGNTYLRLTENASRTGKVGGRDAMYASMVGRSPLTNRDERVLLYNMQLNNGDYFVHSLHYAER